MAAISLIAGSVVGWLAAALSLALGSLLSTAFLVFVATSLLCAVLMILFAHRKSEPSINTIAD